LPNLSLSRKQAESVRTYLIQRGIRDLRLFATGYRAPQPAATNKTAAGIAQDYRVELVVKED
jgi:OOP family OmpA-OmpF porin